MHWRYHILGQLGTGGGGNVFLADDALRAGPVALKVAAGAAGRQLRREFLLMKSLGHESLPQAYDLCRDGDDWQLSLEQVPGAPLSGLLAGPAGDGAAALLVWAALAEALRYLHQQGVVHGDLQPGNILVDGSAVKLIDLGLSRRSPAGRPGAFAGLPAYAAPELLRGDCEPSAAADIYALGLLVWALAGNSAPTVEERLDPRASWIGRWRGAMPERAQEVLFTMLRYDPWQRFASGAALVDAMIDAGLAVRRQGAGRGAFVGRGRELRSALRLVRAGAAPAIRVAAAPGSGATSFLLRLTALLQAGGRDSAYLDARTLRPEQLVALPVPAGTVILADHCGEATLSLLRQRGNQLVYAATGSGGAATGPGPVLTLPPLTSAQAGQLVGCAFSGMPAHEAGLLASHLLAETSGHAGALAGRLGGYYGDGSIAAGATGWVIDWSRLLPADRPDALALRRRWQRAADDGNPGAMIHYGRQLCLSAGLAGGEVRRYADKTVELHFRRGERSEALQFWEGLERPSGASTDYFIRLAKLRAAHGDRDGADRALLRARQAGPDQAGQQRIAAFGLWLRRDGRARESLAELRQLLWADLALPAAVLFELAEYIVRLALELKDWPVLLEESGKVLALDLSGVPPYDQGMMHNQRGYAFWQAGDLGQAGRELSRGLLLADDGMGDIGLTDILCNLALTAIARGDWEPAGAYLDRALRALPPRQQDEYRAYMLVNLGIINEHRGQYRRARDNNLAAAAISARRMNLTNEVLSLANAAQLEQVLGNDQPAQLLLQRCLALAEADATGVCLIKARKEQLFVLVWQQRWAEAWEQFQSYRALARQHGQQCHWEALVNGATAAIELGRAGDAAPVVSELQQRAEGAAQRHDAALAAGALAAVAGDPATAVAAMLAAAAAMHQDGRQLAAARAWLWAARAALARQDGSNIGRVLDGLHAAEALLHRDGVRGLWQRSRDLIVEASRLQQATAAGGQAIALLDGFYRLATQVGVAADDSAVAGTALGLAVELLEAERGGLFLADGRGGLVLAAQVGLDPATRQDARDYSREAVQRAAREQAEIVSNDAQLDSLFASRASVQQNAIRSLLCAPVRYREGAIGALYLDSRLRHGIFSPQRREFLKAWCAIAGAVLESNRMLAGLQRQNDALRAGEPAALRAMIGTSAAMQRVMAEIRTIAPTDARVLITGESGTGKELAARAVHQLSPRRDRVFLALDCGSLPPGLLEAELFGYVRGAFTGAYGDKDGLFAAADRGTIFLDEVTSASLDVQAKLLRVIETGELRRVGDTAQRHVDVRLICASNRDMAAEINAGRFKEDLFYRMNVLRLQLPPLRERGDDILVLAEHFKNRFQQEHGRPGMRFSEQARAAMLGHAWPGNIRELENMVKRAVILTTGRVIGPEHIGLAEDRPANMGLRQETDLVKRKRLADTLRASGNNITRTAEMLGITRRQVHRLIVKYKLK